MRGPARHLCPMHPVALRGQASIPILFTQRCTARGNRQAAWLNSLVVCAILKTGRHLHHYLAEYRLTSNLASAMAALSSPPKMKIQAQK